MSLTTSVDTPYVPVDGNTQEEALRTILNNLNSAPIFLRWQEGTYAIYKDKMIAPVPSRDGRLVTAQRLERVLRSL